MKIHARQHIPTFVETDTRQTADVTSVEDLLAVPWIARWAESWPAHEQTVRVTSWPDGVRTETQETRQVEARTFHRWSLSDNKLMVECNGGDWFWVVAYLTSDEPIPLPAWRETETARLRRERWNRGDTSA